VVSSILSRDPAHNFLAMDWNFFRRFDAYADLIALHADHGHDDVLADHYGLSSAPREYQHGVGALPGGERRL
jgi:hypothetical protein